MLSRLFVLYFPSTSSHCYSIHILHTILQTTEILLLYQQRFKLCKCSLQLGFWIVESYYICISMHLISCGILARGIVSSISINYLLIIIWFSGNELFIQCFVSHRTQTTYSWKEATIL